MGIKILKKFYKNLHKDMTREEQIKNYAVNNYISDDINDTSYGLIIETAEWADETMLDKACKWLKENVNKYSYVIEVEGTKYMKVHFTDSLIEDFSKAMKK